MSVAQFPGSMYPTLTRYAGPANAQSFRGQAPPDGMLTLEKISGNEGVSGNQATLSGTTAFVESGFADGAMSARNASLESYLIYIKLVV